jgi:hypothetical protein
MTRLLAFVFSAILFAVVLAHEAAALRGRGVHVGGANLRGFSAGATRGGLRVRNFSGYRAAAWGGRRYWNGARRGYGYGAGLAALGGAYAYYNSPYYGYSYSGYPAYGYSASNGYSSASGTYGYSDSVATEAVGPGNCGTYRYWKDGRCTDARSK